MLARRGHRWQAGRSKDDWRAELRATVRDLPGLCRLLDLDPRLAAAGAAAAERYTLRVPKAWLDLIERGNPEDPLLLQILPTEEEMQRSPGFTQDPVGDQSAQVTPCLLNKYSGRALLLVTGSCPVHCRYCFRRWFPFVAGLNHRLNAAQAIGQLARRSDVTEVILSGGDPLLLNDHSLQTLLTALDGLPHLKRVRIHSRIPITLPRRIDARLCRILREGRKPRVLVVQTNHPSELGEEALAALARLQANGVRLLNQSVLLRGINDDAIVLHRLSEQLFEAGVMPYYLHQLDRVLGSAHFEVPPEVCAQIDSKLRATLPGYLVPRLVVEKPGAPGKIAFDQAGQGPCLLD